MLDVPGSMASHAQLPEFPGAQGFGAIASGGRGGTMLQVTTLDPDPAGTVPGSLNHALAQARSRTIVFRVSGVIHGVANLRHGDVTIAGQTSPGGITVRGLLCDGHDLGVSGARLSRRRHRGGRHHHHHHCPTRG